MDSKVKVEELSGYIVELYKAGGESMLLVGPPGIGKSVSVKDAAKEIARALNKEFVDYDDSFAHDILANPEKYFVYVDFNLNDCEPSDLTGIPRENDLGIFYKPFLWAVSLAKCEGMLFLDDLTNIQRLDVITASYKIILDHRSGFTKFRDNVMVVAAGNFPDESTAANLLPNPLINRFIVLGVEMPEINGWISWMNKKYDEWDLRTAAYLKYFPDHLLKLPEEAESLDNFPTPRSWTKVASVVKKISPRRQDTFIAGLLGSEAGGRFSAFLRTEIPDIEELIRNPQMFRDLGVEAKYLSAVFAGAYIRNKLKSREKLDERPDMSVAESTLPLLEAIGDVQGDLVILALLSCGEQRFEVAAYLSRKNRTIGELLERVSLLRQQAGV